MSTETDKAAIRAIIEAIHKAHHDKDAAAIVAPYAKAAAVFSLAPPLSQQGMALAETPARLMLAEGVGMLIALLDTGALDRRRPTVVNRLRQLQHTDDFASLPEDLRERIREITAEAER